MHFLKELNYSNYYRKLKDIKFLNFKDEFKNYYIELLRMKNTNNAFIYLENENKLSDYLFNSITSNLTIS